MQWGDENLVLGQTNSWWCLDIIKTYYLLFVPFLCDCYSFYYISQKLQFLCPNISVFLLNKSLMLLSCVTIFPLFVKQINFLGIFLSSLVLPNKQTNKQANFVLFVFLWWFLIFVPAIYLCLFFLCLPLLFLHFA